jgi:exopolysaccharide production protein ExoQ
MSPSLATGVFVFGILGLFVLDREPKARTSWALWLPIMWLLIAGSRHVSTWLGIGPAMSQGQYLEGSPLDATIYALLLAAAIVVLLGRHRIVASLLQRNWPILMFVLYCAISIVWSDYPSVALKRWIKSLGDYAMVLILLTEHDRARAIKQVLARVAFVLLPLSVLFIKYYPDLGRAYAAHWEGTQFFVGVADTKNMLGMTCLVFGFAAFWRVLQVWCGPRRERIKTLIVHCTVLAMAIWLLILSDSKTSLSCFVLTSGLIAAHTFLKVARKRVVVHLLVAAVVLSCFSVLFLGIGGGALQTMGRNPTLTGRTDIWDVLLKVPINPVFGTGFESFWLGKRLAFLWSFPIVNGITEAHNGYLEVYLNLGWVGVAFLAGLLSTGYRNIVRLLDRDPEAGRLGLGLFVIAVVYNFTEAGIRTTDPMWIAFILAITALPQLPLARVPVAKTRPATTALVEVEQVV